MTALAYVLKKDLRQTALAVLRLSVGKIPAIENRSDLVDQDDRIIWSVQNILMHVSGSIFVSSGKFSSLRFVMIVTSG